MYDLKTVMSWLEGLTEDDWEEWYSHSEVQNTAKAAMELLKEQENEDECCPICGIRRKYGNS